MWSYFKPLRRKLGAFTLVLSCLFAVCLIRSLNHADMFVICRSFVLISGGGKFLVAPVAEQIQVESCAYIGGRVVMRRMETMASGQPTGFEWSSAPVVVTPASASFKTNQSDDFSMRDDRISYWVILLSLTLLSAYLLLSKPRPHSRFLRGVQS